MKSHWGDLFMRKTRAVSSPDRLQQPDVRGCFLVQLISLWIRRLLLWVWRAVLGPLQTRLEEVTAVGLRASGDAVAPKDSPAVESWSLRKNESGK